MIINEILNRDCLEVIKTLPDNSIDLILQDPPYNTTDCDWEYDIIEYIEEFWKEWKRISKPNGTVIMTAAQPFSSKLVMSNLKDFKYEMVWVKTRATDFFNANNKPLKKHEVVLVFSFGNCANLCTNKMTYNPQGVIENPRFVRGRKESKNDDIGHQYNRKSHKKRDFKDSLIFQHL